MSFPFLSLHIPTYIYISQCLPCVGGGWKGVDDKSLDSHWPFFSFMFPLLFALLTLYVHLYLITFYIQSAGIK